MLKNLIYLFMLCFLYSCLEPQIDWANRERIGPEDAQLFDVIYEGVTLPPLVTNEDYSEKLDQVTQSEYYKKLLNSYFGKRHDLWGYGVADFDNDGNTNWQVSVYSRKIICKDSDIDGDNVPNIGDADPYNPQVTFSDDDQDGIPNHLDWSYLGKSEALIHMQDAIFNDSNIIVFNKDDQFDLEFLEVIHVILKETFQNTQTPLKYISAGAGKNEHGGNSAANAFYSERRHEITINLGGRKRNLFQMIKVVAHELGHAVHFNNKEFINQNLLDRLWNEKLFKGKKTTYHRSQMRKSYDKMRREGNIFNSENVIMPLSYSNYASENFILSSYSVENAQEYFAESFAAFVLLKAIDQEYFNAEDVFDNINFNPFNIHPRAKELIETHLGFK